MYRMSRIQYYLHKSESVPTPRKKHTFEFMGGASADAFRLCLLYHKKCQYWNQCKVGVRFNLEILNYHTRAFNKHAHRKYLG